MRTRKLLIALLAMFALIAAACGDDDDGAVASSGGDDSEAPEGPAIKIGAQDFGESAILAEIGLRVGSEIKLAVAPVSVEHPLIWTEQLLPVLPVARVKNVDEAIHYAVKAEHGFGHSAAMHSMHLGNLDKMARVINCSIFVKNGPIYAGLGEGGEGYTSFSIASPTGEGLTGPLTFSRVRRCVVKGHFRIV